METYVKVFGSIIHSSVWQTHLHVKVTWITMLAMADKEGNVWASVPGLAKAAGVTIKQCNEALRLFLAPDPYSRTKDHDGRRIAEIEGGWKVLNYCLYRKLASQDPADKGRAKKQKRYRDRKKSQQGNVAVTLPAVTPEAYNASTKHGGLASETPPPKRQDPELERILREHQLAEQQSAEHKRQIAAKIASAGDSVLKTG